MLPPDVNKSNVTTQWGFDHSSGCYTGIKYWSADASERGLDRMQRCRITKGGYSAATEC